MNRSEMKRLLDIITRKDCHQTKSKEYEALEKIRRAIMPYLPPTHVLLYLPNNEEIMNKKMESKRLIYTTTEILGLIADDNYNSHDEYIEEYSFRTISKENLRILYARYAYMIMHINELINSMDKDNIKAIKEEIGWLETINMRSMMIMLKESRENDNDIPHLFF